MWAAISEWNGCKVVGPEHFVWLQAGLRAWFRCRSKPKRFHVGRRGRTTKEHGQHALARARTGRLWDVNRGAGTMSLHPWVGGSVELARLCPNIPRCGQSASCDGRLLKSSHLSKSNGSSACFRPLYGCKVSNDEQAPHVRLSSRWKLRWRRDDNGLVEPHTTALLQASRIESIYASWLVVGQWGGLASCVGCYITATVYMLARSIDVYRY